MKIDLANMNWKETFKTYYFNLGIAGVEHPDFSESEEFKNHVSKIRKICKAFDDLENSSIMFNFDYYKAETELLEKFKNAVENFRNACPFEWEEYK